MSRLLLAAALWLAAAPARAQDEGDGTRSRAGLLRMGGMLLFSDTEGPLAWGTAGARPEGSVDLGEVRMRACQRGLSVPLNANIRPTSISAAGGRGGYQSALEQLRKTRPDAAGFYDVRVDARVFSILGIYRSLCTLIEARAYK